MKLIKLFKPEVMHYHTRHRSWSEAIHKKHYLYDNGKLIEFKEVYSDINNFNNPEIINSSWTEIELESRLSSRL